MKSLVIFCVMLLALLQNCSYGVFQTAAGGKYPLNDPRNPNCPCHQYQAQANREYAALTGKNMAQQQAASGETEASSGKTWRRQRMFHRSHTAHRKGRQNAATRKTVHDRLSRCFHF